MRPLTVLVLAALVLAPLPLAQAAPPLATETLLGPGWVAWRVQAAAGWTLDVQTHAQTGGDFFAAGTTLLSASGASLFSSYSGYSFESAARVRVRSDTAGLDVIDQDANVLAAYHRTLMVTCAPCPAQTLVVVTMMGGDVAQATFELRGTGLTILSTTRGDDVLAGRQEEFVADVDAEAALGVGPRVVVGTLEKDVGSTLVGAFGDDGALHPGLWVTRPGGSRVTCDCAFPASATGAGRYLFEAKEVDAAGGVLLIVADVQLPP